MKRFPLEQLTALEESVFTGVVFRPRDVRWVTLVLQKLQVSGTVETLRFETWSFSPYRARTFDWNAIKACLIAMPRLRVVEFELSGRRASETRSIVQEKSEWIEKKCSLKLSVEDD